jgi:hypothetical protein
MGNSPASHDSEDMPAFMHITLKDEGYRMGAGVVGRQHLALKRTKAPEGGFDGDPKKCGARDGEAERGSQDTPFDLCASRGQTWRSADRHWQ